MRLIRVKMKQGRKPVDFGAHGYQVHEHGYLRLWVRLVDDMTRDVFTAYPGAWEWVRDEGELD